jgi:hypothetical protein
VTYSVSARRRINAVLALCLVTGFYLGLAGTALAAPKKPSAPAPAAASFLPTMFAGWQSTASQTSTNPAAADAANVTVLKEYGFTEFESASYSRDGVTLTLRAIRFQDASGAYGAYTFYRQPGMAPVSIGKQGVFDGAHHIVFWTGDTLLDGVFSQLTAMSASDLRELASMLPQPDGAASLQPQLPTNLPPAGLQSDTIRYALGADAYARAGGVLPPALVDFTRDVEAVTAQYQTRNGDGALTLLNYPTPQIAAERLRAVQSYLQHHDAASVPQPLAESSTTSLIARRSGPIVVLTSGNFTADQAKLLSQTVHYDADVTWNNPKGYISEESRAVHLVLGIFALIAFLLGVTILVGFFVGGGRILVRKLRGKPTTSLEEAEFTKLNLS